MRSLNNCFSRGELCKPFWFSRNLSAFISQFQCVDIWALCNFFGQEDHSSPKSECARTLMLPRYMSLEGTNCLDFVMCEHTKNVPN